MNTADLLDAAADRLNAMGWTRFDSTSEPGSTCMVLALCNVCDRAGVSSYDACSALKRASGSSQVFGLCDLYAWNDAPGRTKDEVIALLRATATIERMKETASCPPSTLPSRVAVPA